MRTFHGIVNHLIMLLNHLWITVQSFVSHVCVLKVTWTITLLKSWLLPVWILGHCQKKRSLKMSFLQEPLKRQTLVGKTVLFTVHLKKIWTYPLIVLSNSIITDDLASTLGYAMNHGKKAKKKLAAPEISLTLDRSEGSLLSDELDESTELDLDDIDTPSDNSNEFEWEGRNFISCNDSATVIFSTSYLIILFVLFIVPNITSCIYLTKWGGTEIISKKFSLVGWSKCVIRPDFYFLVLWSIGFFLPWSYRYG